MPSHRKAPLSQSKREAFRQAVLLRDGPTCRMPVCLMPTRTIDLTLRCPTPGAYTADHIIEVSMGGAPYDPANGRPAHYRCNVSKGCGDGNRRRKGKRMTRKPTFKTSRPW